MHQHENRLYLVTMRKVTVYRVWLHAFVLIYSPDTDKYHVGLPLLEKYIHTEVTVQLAPSPPARPYSDSRFLLLNRLHQALHHDLDLADIKQSTLTAVLQVVFVTIGCDCGCKCIQCRNVQSGSNMKESDDDLLMEEATEETRARGVLERTHLTTEDEGSTIYNDSDADRLSLKATNEHASDGTGSDSATV